MSLAKSERFDFHSDFLESRSEGEIFDDLGLTIGDYVAIGHDRGESCGESGAIIRFNPGEKYKQLFVAYPNGLGTDIWQDQDKDRHINFCCEHNQMAMMAIFAPGGSCLAIRLGLYFSLDVSQVLTSSDKPQRPFLLVNVDINKKVEASLLINENLVPVWKGYVLEDQPKISFCEEFSAKGDSEISINDDRKKVRKSITVERVDSGRLAFSIFNGHKEALRWQINPQFFNFSVEDYEQVFNVPMEAVAEAFNQNTHRLQKIEFLQNIY